MNSQIAFFCKKLYVVFGINSKPYSINKVLYERIDQNKLFFMQDANRG